MYLFMEVLIINNNESYILKGRIDSTIFEVLKVILSKKKMTQQDLIESFAKDFVFQNLDLIINKETTNKDTKGLK